MNSDVDMQKFFNEHKDIFKKMYDMCKGKGACNFDDMFKLMKGHFDKSTQGGESK